VTSPQDPAAQALEDLITQLRESAAVFDQTALRATGLLAHHSRGASWRCIMSNEPQPLVVEVMTAELERLTQAAGRWRRENARALYTEGLTMDKIAELFRVTRQRVSVLLQPPPASPDKPSPPPSTATPR